MAVVYRKYSLTTWEVQFAVMALTAAPAVIDITRPAKRCAANSKIVKVQDMPERIETDAWKTEKIKLIGRHGVKKKRWFASCLTMPQCWLWAGFYRLLYNETDSRKEKSAKWLYQRTDAAAETWNHADHIRDFLHISTRNDIQNLLCLVSDKLNTNTKGMVWWGTDADRAGCDFSKRTRLIACPIGKRAARIREWITTLLRGIKEFFTRRNLSKRWK